MLRRDESKKNNLIYREHLSDLIDRVNKIQHLYTQQLALRKQRHPVTEIFKKKEGSHGADVASLVAAANEAALKMLDHDKKSMDPYRDLSKNAVQAYINEGKTAEAENLLRDNQKSTCFDGYTFEMCKLLDLLAKELLTGLYKDIYKNGFPNGFRLDNYRATFFNADILNKLEDKIGKINNAPNDDHYLRLIYGLLKEVNEQFPLSQYDRVLFSSGNQYAYVAVAGLLDREGVHVLTQNKDHSETVSRRVITEMKSGNYETIPLKNSHRGEAMPTWEEMTAMQENRRQADGPRQ